MNIYIKPNNLDKPIEFSDNVIVLPNILRIFSRPLWVTNPTPSFDDRREWVHRDYINQGEILYRFNVRVGSWFFTKEVPINIINPISGLLLDSYTDIQMGDFFHNSSTYVLNTKLLVPKNQKIPVNASEMYKDFCAFCYNNTEIFLKDKLTREELISTIEKQAKAPFQVLSLKKDFPEIHFDTFT